MSIPFRNSNDPAIGPYGLFTDMVMRINNLNADVTRLEAELEQFRRINSVFYFQVPNLYLVDIDTTVVDVNYLTTTRDAIVATFAAFHSRISNFLDRVNVADAMDVSNQYTAHIVALNTHLSRANNLIRDMETALGEVIPTINELQAHAANNAEPPRPASAKP